MRKIHLFILQCVSPLLFKKPGRISLTVLLEYFAKGHRFNHYLGSQEYGHLGIGVFDRAR